MSHVQKTGLLLKQKTMQNNNFTGHVSNISTTGIWKHKKLRKHFGV